MLTSSGNTNGYRWNKCSGQATIQFLPTPCQHPSQFPRNNTNNNRWHFWELTPSHFSGISTWIFYLHQWLRDRNYYPHGKQYGRENRAAESFSNWPKVASLASGGESLKNCGTFQALAQGLSSACKKAFWRNLAILVLQENKASRTQLIVTPKPESTEDYIE